MTMASTTQQQRRTSNGGTSSQRPSRTSGTTSASEQQQQSGGGITSLMYSCQQGDLHQVKKLLHRKPSCVRERDRTGKTALHYCAENATADIVQLLLLTQQQQFGPTAAPTTTNAASAFESFLNAADEEGYTALHLAVIAGNRAVVRYLLERGADVNAVDNELHSAVHWATVCGELESLDLLLDHSSVKASTADIHGAYPLHYAAQMCGHHGHSNNRPSVVKQQHQQVTMTAMPVTAGGGRNGTATATATAIAKSIGLTALKKLISRSSSSRTGSAVNVVDRDGRQPLLWAASSGSADAILALCNAGANVTAADKDGLTALHCAASRGHCECIETLITLCGADVDLADLNGCTALFYAVTLGHADCAQLLLDCGANANHQDKKGRTAAYCGATKGQLETLRLLAQSSNGGGCDLWMRSSRGDVALHEAVASGRKELVLWLLRQYSQQQPKQSLVGASITAAADVHQQQTVATAAAAVQNGANVANNDGRTPLHVAAVNNNIEMCKILIDHGAEVNCIMRNSRGELATPLDAALRRGNRGCAKFLQLHGGLAAAKLTDSRALQRALSQAYMDSQQQQQYLHQQRVSVTVHQQTQSELDYPSLTDSQMSSVSAHVPSTVHNHNPHHQHQSLPFNNNNNGMTTGGGAAVVAVGIGGRISRLEDSATQTQVEDGGSYFSESVSRNDLIHYTAASDQGGGEPQSGLGRRRKVRRLRTQQLSSLHNSSSNLESRPPPNDEELRWKSRQTMYSDEEDDAGGDDDDDDLDRPSRGGGVGTGVDYRRSLALGVMEKPTMNHYISDGGIGDGGGAMMMQRSQFSSSISPIAAGGGGTESQASSQVASHSNATETKDSGLGGFSSDLSVVMMLANGGGGGGSSSGERGSEDETTAAASVILQQQQQQERDNKGFIVAAEDGKVQGAAESTTAVNKVIAAGPGPLSQNKKQQQGVITTTRPTFQLRRTKSERSPAAAADTSGGSSSSRIPISIVRAAQVKTRKYNLERKIFQQLLELKQMQIRSGQANEQVFAKRLIDAFKRDASTVGLRPYDGTYSFHQLESYLYSQLRLVQQGAIIGGGGGSESPDSSSRPQMLPQLGPSSSLIAIGGRSATPPVEDCTHKTQRCSHAMYAYTSVPPACYTGVPCAAYIPYHRHDKPFQHGAMMIQQQQPHHQLFNGRVVVASNNPSNIKTGGGRTILPKLKAKNNNNI